MKRGFLSFSGATLLALCGCQAILGFEELEPAGSGSAGSSGNAGSSGAANTGSGTSGVACEDAAECAEELTCLYGYCRPACLDDTYCEQGSVCLWGGDGFGGCRLAKETCEQDGCDNAELVCGLDSTCRIACSDVSSCEAPTQRCVAGACVSTVGEDVTTWECGDVPDGEISCNEGKLSVCNVTAPGLDVIEDCGGTALCERSLPDDTTYDAEAPPACATGCPAGEPYCQGATLLICEDDGSGPVGAGETCETAELCAVAEAAGETTCAAPVCAVNDVRCGGGQTELWWQRCAVGRDEFEDIEECSDATAQCNPGASECFALEVDPTEVTVGAYQTWLGTTPSTAGQPTACVDNTDFAPESNCGPASPTANQPVVCVDWCDAYAYCKAKGKHLCGKIGGGMNPYDRYDDPGSSEWMNACSAGGQFDYGSGAAPVSGQNECVNTGTQLSAGYDVTTRPNCKSPSPGYQHLRHLTGNVEEWEDSCEDTVEAGTPLDACRTRGGSFDSVREDTRCDAVPASAWKRGEVSETLGFRCCG